MLLRVCRRAIDSGAGVHLGLCTSGRGSSLRNSTGLSQTRVTGSILDDQEQLSSSQYDDKHVPCPVGVRERLLILIAAGRITPCALCT